MKALFENFEQLSIKTQELLEKGIEHMREGFAPDDAYCQEVSTSLSLLRSTYDEIRQKLPTQILNSELPSEDASIKEYEKAWNNSIVNRRQIIRDVLSEFILVYSDEQKYMDAIVPHLDNAKNLLSEIDSEAGKSEKTDVSAYKLFLEGVKEDLTINEDLYEQLLDCNFFSARIVKGLSEEKYKIRNEATTDKQKSNDLEDKTETTPITSITKIIADDSDEKSHELNEITHEQVPENEDAAPKIDSADTEPIIESEDQDTNITDGGLDKTTEDKTEYIHPINPIKQSKILSDQKLKELINRTGTVFHFLVDRLVFNGLLDEETVFEANSKYEWPLSKEQCREIISYLERKGLLCIYAFESRNILCFTDLMDTCLQKSSLASIIKRTFDIKKIGKIYFTGKQNMPLNEFTKHLALVDQYQQTVSMLFDDEDSFHMLPTASWDLKNKYFQLNLAIGEDDYLPLRIVPAEMFAESPLSEGEGLFCHAETLPIMDGVQDAAHYCLTYEGLFQWVNNAWVAITHDPQQLTDISNEPKEQIEFEEQNETIHHEESQPEQTTEEDNAAEVPVKGTLEEEPSAPNDQQEGLWLDDLSEANKIEPEVNTDEFSSLSSIDMAERLLAATANGSKPDDEKMAALIHRMLAEGERSYDIHRMRDQLAEAMILAKLLATDDSFPVCRNIYNQLHAAVPFIKENTANTGTALINIFAEDTEYTPVAKLCAYIYGMLFPAHAHDHTFTALYNSAFTEYESYFPGLDVLKPLYHKAMEGRKTLQTAFSPANLAALSDSKIRLEHMESIQTKAKDLLKPPTVKFKIHGIPELIDICFGSKTDLYGALEIVSANDIEMREFVEKALISFCKDDEIDTSLIEWFLDSQWSTAAQKYSSRRMGIKYDARKLLINAFIERLSLLREWLDETSTEVETDVEKLRAIKADMLNIIDASIEEISQIPKNVELVIIAAALEVIKAKLQNNGRGISFATMLRSGALIIEQDELVTNEALNRIEFAEPWRNMLKHIICKDYDLHEVYNMVLTANPESELYDNYWQLEGIGRLIQADPKEYELSEDNLRDAITSANLQAKYFREKLEISYAYNRISENDRERFAMLADPETSELQSFYYDHRAFGCWRAFLNALRSQIREIAFKRMKDVRSQLEQARASLTIGEENILLAEAERLIAQDQNYAAAEEYIHRFRIGEKTLPFETSDSATNYYLDFISNDVFSKLYSFCDKRKDSNLPRIVKQYIDKNRPDGWTARNIEAANKFIDKWPVSKQYVNAQNIQDFFGQLGFVVEKSTKENRESEVCCTLSVKRSEQNQADYRHPISIFGTRMKRALEVVCLFGGRTAKQLVDDACKLGINGTFIILIDANLSAADRRSMAQYFFTQKNVGQSSFLVIDRVLALYLALQPSTERLPAMLQCTLPYTIYQPFTNGSGSTDDEMFFGRVNELASIRDMTGTSIVYGGRQLGKTALLERAMHLDNVPSRKEFAIKADFKDCHSEKEFIDTLVDACNETFRNSGIKLNSCSGIKQFCSQIRKLLDDESIVMLRLLLDETDAFLESISGSNYNAILPLIELQRNSNRRFKFVLAGLHNVCRAKNATRNNGLFGQLGAPLCVKPLTATDAQNLLVRPLKYLGFKVTNESHIGTILINTNYYPGIIQFFGFTLVQTLASQYTHYYDAVRGNPPFILHDEQLASIMNSRDLNRAIKDRIRWTLEMDERYFMLARCIAVLYHLSANDYSSISNGFDVSAILEIAKDMFDIHCLASLSEKETVVLLDEMEEMGILSRPTVEENRYLLRRRSFIDVIGTSLETLEHDIELYNEEVMDNARMV